MLQGAIQAARNSETVRRQQLELCSQEHVVKQNQDADLRSHWRTTGLIGKKLHHNLYTVDGVAWWDIPRRLADHILSEMGLVVSCEMLMVKVSPLLERRITAKNFGLGSPDPECFHFC